MEKYAVAKENFEGREMEKVAGQTSADMKFLMSDEEKEEKEGAEENAGLSTEAS
jgi:hypothetical protein